MMAPMLLSLLLLPRLDPSWRRLLSLMLPWSQPVVLMFDAWRNVHSCQQHA